MDISQLREQHYNATVVSVQRIHDMLMKIRIVSDEGKLTYEPGQYTILALGGWERRYDGVGLEAGNRLREKLIKRAYSISCSLFDAAGVPVRCRDYDYLEYYITLVDRPDEESPKRPPLTPRLFALHEGDRLHMSTRIVGHYTLAPIEPDHNLIFAGTGTGEAPHNAMAAELLACGHRGKIANLTCVRYLKDAAYTTEQAKLEDQFDNYRYHLYTTRESINVDQADPNYIGKQYLQDAIVDERFERENGWRPDPQTTHVYLCGNPDMIGIPHKNDAGEMEFPQPIGMLELLNQHGFIIDPHNADKNVHYEKYW